MQRPVVGINLVSPQSLPTEGLNMAQNDETTPDIRIGQSLLSATYIYRGYECLGFYFYDATQGYWRAIHPDYEVFSNEEECKKRLQGLPLYDDENL